MLTTEDDSLLLLIFTDLDGTLLNPEDYRYEPAIPVLKRLKALNIPVIPVTSKTRQEVEVLRQALDLTGPFITENGSGVFVAAGDRQFQITATESWGPYNLLRLGCTYEEARQGLIIVSRRLEQTLRGFGDLSLDELIERTGLSSDEAKLAKARDFTEPFVTPKTVPPDVIEDVVQASGFRVVVGDRFSHLIGRGAGKGKAARLLTDAYQMPVSGPNQLLTTIGLGNSPNDRDLLEAVDIPIIIPGRDGPHPGLVGRGWQVGPTAGAQGWAKVVNQLCDRLLA
jgi:mannosyl-3-phosphoglycerate phosphatase